MMAISDRTIITRMQRELQTLQDKTPSRTELQQHIGNVQLMCELLLENPVEESGAEQPQQQSVSDKDMLQMLGQTPEMTEEEYNVMIKGKGTSNGDNVGNSYRRKSPTQGKLTNHDEANGESIFDF